MFNPDKWSRAVYFWCNNCFAYAMNDWRVSRENPQPGVASGQQYTYVRKQQIVEASVRDGLIWAENPAPKAGSYLVALLVWNDRDYHWIRQDRDGGWSHKSGPFSPKREDFFGAEIVLPHLSQWGQYEFSGYLYVPKGGLKVEEKKMIRAPAPVQKGFKI
ncbi:MAG TPA: hypothetical protein DCW68_02410 [Rhodospirillaceae bacterium]|nr:hypothetical protein [Rhodospirillaceae bacterium]